LLISRRCKKDPLLDGSASVAIGANLFVTRSRTARRLLESARFGKQRVNSNRYAAQRLSSSPINLTGNAHTAEVIGLRSRTRIRVRDFVPTWKKIPPPARLKDIRKWLNVMLAHLTMHRTEPTFKIGEVTRADI
jgi:hypothetical protein